MLSSSLRFAAWVVIACIALGFLIPVSSLFTALAKFFMVRQDIWLAGTMVLFYGICAYRPQLSGGVNQVLRPFDAIAIVVAIAMATWGLRKFVLFDFDLSGDERMVAFDMAIFSGGQLLAPFPPEWREWYKALNVTHILPVGDREGWVSAYLPGNAALRAAVSHIVPDALISPLLLVVGGIALWRITLRIWPDSPGTRSVTLILFACSSQVILMGATRYAMTAHLTANLVWLWLFLQRRPASHAGAIALGFLATGLHQPLFHPVFVAPFLDLLRREKRWSLLAVYVLCYGAFGLFWLSWPGWISAHGSLPVPLEYQTAGISFLDRFRSAAATLSALSFELMGANLVRFATWQHLLLLPLMIVGLRTAFRAEPLCRALALGMALLVLAILLLLPAQAHGWGYRYLHGFIGSAVMIAGFGWHRLEREGLAPHRAFRWATVLSLLVLLPLHVWMARTFIAPYAWASSALSRSQADLLIVDDAPIFAGDDLVRNRPDLSNRPILLRSSELDPASLERLCAGRRKLAFADAQWLAPIEHMFGSSLPQGPGPAQKRLHDAASGAGCRVVPL